MVTPVTLITQYISYFNRAPDPDGFSYWLGIADEQDLSVVQLARSFSGSAEAQDIYPLLGTPGFLSEARVETFLETVYQNLFNRGPDTGGLGFYVPRILDGRLDVEEAIAQIINGAKGDDAVVLNNKAEAALYFVETFIDDPDFAYLDADGTPVPEAEALAKSVVASVDGTADSTEDVRAKVDAYADALANEAPIGVDDTATASEDAALAVPAAGILSNDTDPEGGMLAVTAVNGDAASVGSPINLASGAVLTLNADGSYTYDPNGSFENLTANQFATDTFGYTVSDAFGTSDAATVTITIEGQGDANTFTLTEAIDRIPGLVGSNGTADNTGDNVIIAGATASGGVPTNTLGSGDILDGGEGFDALRLFSEFHDLLVAQTSNIERIDVQASNADADLSLINATGVEQIWNYRPEAGRTVTVTSIQDNAVAGFFDTGAGARSTYSFASDVDFGGALDVALDGADTATLTVDGDSTAAVKTLNVLVNVLDLLPPRSRDNVLTLDMPTADLETLTVSNANAGVFDVTLREAANAFETLTKIDSTTLEGAFDIDLSDNDNDVDFDGGNGDITVVIGNGNNAVETGRGNDRITAGAGDDTVVSGAGNDRIVAGPGDNQVEAGAGNDRITVDEAGDNTVDAGPGNDRVDFGAQANTRDSASGGTGDADVIVIDVDVLASLTATKDFEGAIDGFELVDAPGIVPEGQSHAIDLDNLDDIDELITDGTEAGALQGTLTVNYAAPGGILQLDGDNAGTTTVTVTSGAPGVADAFTVVLRGAHSDSTGTLSLPGIESLDVVNRGKDQDRLDLETDGIEAVVLTGRGGVDFSVTPFLDLTSLDATALTGGRGTTADVRAQTKASDDAILLGGAGDDDLTGGAGDDRIDSNAGDDVIRGGLGADVLTGGAGSDLFDYDAARESQGSSIDTITDFVSGTDIINLLGINPDIDFIGNVPSFAAGISALTDDPGLGASDVFFDTSTSRLVMDADDDGDIDGDDVTIVLRNGGAGLTGLTERDLNLVGATFTANTGGAFQTDDRADSVEGTIVGGGDDTINTTTAELMAPGTVVDGGAGTDTLNVTDDAASLKVDSSVNNVEVINLLEGSSGAVTLSNASSLAGVNVQSGTKGAIVTFTDAFGSSAVDVTGGGGNDSVSLGDDAYSGAFDGKAGSNSLATDDTDISGVSGGGVVTGFQILTLAGGTTTMTTAQHNGFSTIVGNGHAIDLTTAGASVAGVASVGAYTLSDESDVFTLGAVGQSVAGNLGNDAITVSGALVGTVDGGGGTDTLVVDGVTDVTGATYGGFEQIDLSANGQLTITETQLSGSGARNLGANTALAIVDAGAAGITTAVGTSLATDVDADTVTLGDNDDTVDVDTGFDGTLLTGAGNDAVIYGSGSHDSDVVLGRGNDSVTFGGTLGSGALVAGGMGIDTLNLTDGADISAGDLTSFDVLTLAPGTFTVTVAQFNALFSVGSAPGTQTVIIPISSAAPLIISNDNTSGRGQIETYSFINSATVPLSLIEAAGTDDETTINLAAGSATEITLDNVAIDAGLSGDEFVINGFEAPSDTLLVEVGGAAFDTAFVSLSSAGSDVSTGANAVVEITTGIGTAADLQDASDGGGVEALIASAVEATDGGGLVSGDDLTFIAYDAAGNAGVYTAEITNVDGNLETADFFVELVGVLNGVGADALESSNFI